MILLGPKCYPFALQSLIVIIIQPMSRFHLIPLVIACKYSCQIFLTKMTKRHNKVEEPHTKDNNISAFIMWGYFLHPYVQNTISNKYHAE